MRIVRNVPPSLKAQLRMKHFYVSDCLLPWFAKWVLAMVEGDNETRYSFDIEQHAHSYADGKRIRLGLPPLGRHVSTTRLNGGGGALPQQAEAPSKVSGDEGA